MFDWFSSMAETLAREAYADAASGLAIILDVLLVLWLRTFWEC
jgi:hypothetical protein